MAAHVIVHIPHSSALIPEQERAGLVIPDDKLKQELLRMTDWYTDQLFNLGETAIPVIFPVSRLVCDPERFANDADEPMAAQGMGAVYTHTSDGRPLRPSLNAEERQRLLDAYYFPHHQKLEQIVQSALADHGHCLIIDAHSFPSSPLPCDRDQSASRPDICLGTDPFHTPDWLADAAKRAFRDLGWRVELNRPYPGALVPLSLYERDARVHSIMVEINRALYLDETTGERLPHCGKIALRAKSALRTVIASFGSV